ncbi:carbohydrate ABC transporter permease [Actinokineospora sp. HUAS TT18]|uniref:carbohydrate ABC transporter permease n=1 Tax=Actinokineospora sp. HUAS TT18 TaxID=3447451 RepID=UPI003F51F5C7
MSSTVSTKPPVSAAGSAAGAAPRRRTRPGGPRRNLAAAGFLLPAAALVAIVLLVPFGATVYRSLLTDDLVPVFGGLSAYAKLFDDPALSLSLLNTLMWMAGTLLLPVGFGLAIAVMTNAQRWGRIARLAVVLPYAISGSAVAVIWGYMLRSDGAVNQLLAGLGLESWAHDWLLEDPLNTLGMIMANTWQATGVAVILFLVGLQTIPPETVEAASIDGADGWVRFRHIVLPQLRPVTYVVVGISLANALRTFDVIWVMTQGGPARSSETLALSMYRESFLLQRPGVGSAIAVVLTLIVLASSWVYLRGQGKAAS